MTEYLAPLAAFAALIAKAFTTNRTREMSARLVALVPTTSRMTTQQSRLSHRHIAGRSHRCGVHRD